MNPVPGTCRYCGCTESEPCTQCKVSDGECAWYNDERTSCKAPGCRRAEIARQRADSYDQAKSKYAGWGYGAILEDLRRRRRRARVKRRRAA